MNNLDNGEKTRERWKKRNLYEKCTSRGGNDRFLIIEKERYT